MLSQRLDLMRRAAPLSPHARSAAAARRHRRESAAAVARRRRRRPPPAPAPADPVVAAHRQLRPALRAGQKELELGPLERRPQSSSTGRSTCCSSRPTAARTEPRIREHFDRLVDRISASRCGRLRTATASPRQRTSRRRSTSSCCRGVSATLRHRPADESTRPCATDSARDHDIPIPLNDRVLRFIELFQGRLHDFMEEGMSAGRSTCR